MAKILVVNNTISTLQSGAELGHSALEVTVAPNTTLKHLQVKSTGLTSTGTPVYRIRLYSTDPESVTDAVYLASFDVNLDADVQKPDLLQTALDLSFQGTLWLTYQILNATIGGTSGLWISMTVSVD